MTLVQRTQLLGRPLLKRSLVSQQFLRWGAKAGTVYLVFRYPDLLSSVFGSLAEAVGVPAWLGKVLRWSGLGFLLLFALVWLVGRLLPVAISALRLSVRSLQWLPARLSSSRFAPPP